jgi:type IV secretory pathway TrbD component
MSRGSVVIHQSLCRPILIGGAERTLVFVNGIISAALIFGIGSVEATIFGLLMAVGVHWALVKLATRDPQFSEVYQRHVIYQTYYPARAQYTAPAALVKYWRK